MKSRQRRFTLLYDARCVLCVRTVSALRKLNIKADLAMIPLQEADPTLFPEGVTREQLQSQLHIIDESNRIYRGAEAVLLIMTMVRGWRWLAVLYRVPVLRPLANRLYRWIADHRYKLFGQIDECDSGACTLHSREESKQPPSDSGST
ncbi:thiol-disulfide oxidoreductase DCC family protein [Paenibacillus sp. J2TS4]|uniref:thiol-disulfide oxidoreductase DCC family protein n=1 Tax=Paenibacillus sp. J2TS4 TaxID=2807194 RepID=UPI001B122903|nr:DUF393 domain-containing protein [Paenibacillus sp. J2TS4]GIP31390.1 thiol-disulfide oxidoreductase [Paenibacillus sp. J2TS4]